MGFVCQGRYALAPIEPTDAEKYVNLQLDCMEQTYDPIYFDTLGESFTARHRAERNEYLEDFHRHLSSPTVRGFFAELINQIGVPEVVDHLMATVEAELAKSRNN